MPADPEVRRAMAILTGGGPQLPPPRKAAKTIAPPRRRPPAPPAQSTTRRMVGHDDDAENAAPRRAAPRREPPAKPAPKRAPQRRPPAPKASGARSSTPRLALAQMSTNGSNAQARAETPDDVPAPGSASTNELGPCPCHVSQLPSTKDSSPELWLQPQHSTSEDEDEDDELLRAVEAEVAATAEMLKTEKWRSAYSSSESEGESDLDTFDNGAARESSHRGGSAESAVPVARIGRDEEDAAAVTDAARDDEQTQDTESKFTPKSEEEALQDSLSVDMSPHRSPTRQTTARDSHSTALTPTKIHVDVSTMSPEMDVPTFSIRASRSISSCVDTASNSEATAVASHPIVRKVRGLSLSSQPRRTTTDAMTKPLELNESAVVTSAAAPSERLSGSKVSDAFTSTEVMQLQQRVASLEKQLAAKESALIEAFAIIDQLSAVDRGAA